MSQVRGRNRMLLEEIVIFFFFNDTATTEIYTLSLHDALPIARVARVVTTGRPAAGSAVTTARLLPARVDRKSTRLNSSHPSISYAVFCLQKKKYTDGGPLTTAKRRSTDGR